MSRAHWGSEIAASNTARLLGALRQLMATVDSLLCGVVQDSALWLRLMIDLGEVSFYSGFRRSIQVNNLTQNPLMADPSESKTPVAVRKTLCFYLNGKPITVSGPQATWSLAAWLRRDRGLVGTKVVCNEGDCGACSVLLGRPDQSFAQLHYQAIDSCIAFMYQLDGCHVVTVEGLSVDGTLSPVQEALVRCHGSQCGFCTPGFVMTMHGMIEQGRRFDGCSLREQLSGNLCRCTGYVQILEAGEAIEATGVAKIRELYPEAIMLESMRQWSPQPVEIAIENDSQASRICLPSDFEQAVGYRAADPTATIVSGATDFGVLLNHGRIQPRSILCLSRVLDAREIAVTETSLELGALATWSAIEDAVQSPLPDYYAILNRFGSPQIRRMGTIGGNLASGSPIADSVPLHMALGATLDLVSVRGSRTIRIDDFYLDYRKTALAPDELIRRVVTPLPRSDEKLKLYKISKRRDMDISTVTMAVWAKLSGDTISDARLVLGGVGAVVKRIEAAELFLRGKRWCETTFREAGVIARNTITPWTDVRGSAEYRSLLAENLTMKAFHDLSL